MLFISMLMFSTLMMLSSSSWFMIWMAFEINMISFIPMFLNKKNVIYSEATLKYFLAQAVASSTFIMLSLFNSIELFNSLNLSMNINLLLMLPLLMKLGAAPFQNWFIMVMKKISWFNSAILLTWQKLGPLSILFSMNFNYYFLSTFIVVSLLFGSLGGLNQTYIKNLLTFSSINHIGWLLSCLFLNKMVMLVYFLIYSLLNVFIVINMNLFIFNFNQIFLIKNLSLIMLFLSLAGLPPFMGFFSKWMLIQCLMYSNMNLLTMILFMSSLTTLLFYIRLTLSNMILVSKKHKWMMFNLVKKYNITNMMFNLSNIMMIFLFYLFLNLS